MSTIKRPSSPFRELEKSPSKQKIKYEHTLDQVLSILQKKKFLREAAQNLRDDLVDGEVLISMTRSEIERYVAKNEDSERSVTAIMNFCGTKKNEGRQRTNNIKIKKATVGKEGAVMVDIVSKGTDSNDIFEMERKNQPTTNLEIMDTDVKGGAMYIGNVKDTRGVKKSLDNETAENKSSPENNTNEKVDDEDEWDLSETDQFVEALKQEGFEEEYINMLEDRELDESSFKSNEESKPNQTKPKQITEESILKDDAKLKFGFVRKMMLLLNLHTAVEDEPETNIKAHQITITDGGSGIRQKELIADDGKLDEKDRKFIDDIDAKGVNAEMDNVIVTKGFVTENVRISVRTPSES